MKNKVAKFDELFNNGLAVDKFSLDGTSDFTLDMELSVSEREQSEWREYKVLNLVTQLCLKIYDNLLFD